MVEAADGCCGREIERDGGGTWLVLGCDLDGSSEPRAKNDAGGAVS